MSVRFREDPGPAHVLSGTFCIPGDNEHCCTLDDCGGQFSDLFCNAVTHRCQCEQAGRGRCTGRFRFLCGPCCPGGLDLGNSCSPGGTGDTVCVSDAINGCSCPPATPVSCPFDPHRCSADLNTDSHACGANCDDCAVVDPGSRCCSGQCTRGCNPGFAGSCATGPCGSACLPCPSGQICCNQGPGTPGVCVDGGVTCP